MLIKKEDFQLQYAPTYQSYVGYNGQKDKHESYPDNQIPSELMFPTK